MLYYWITPTYPYQTFNLINQRWFLWTRYELEDPDLKGVAKLVEADRNLWIEPISTQLKKISKTTQKKFPILEKIKGRDYTARMRCGESRRHLALQRGSLRSAPWRSSSVARPPSITATPPDCRRKSVMSEDDAVVVLVVWTSTGPIFTKVQGKQRQRGTRLQGHCDSQNLVRSLALCFILGSDCIYLFEKFPLLIPWLLHFTHI